MNLTLVAVSLNDQPLTQPITAVFDKRGGTIGRADHNTMALPDPQRHISRLQAEIVVHGSEYVIRNVGASNPILVGSKSLAQGETMRLQDDAELRLGGYLLKAQLGPHPTSSIEVQAHRSGMWAEPVAAMGAAQRQVNSREEGRLIEVPLAADPFFADLFPIGGQNASASTSQPFKDLLDPVLRPDPPIADIERRPAAQDPFPSPAGVDPRSRAVAAPVRAEHWLPDDFDPMAPGEQPDLQASHASRSLPRGGADLPYLAESPSPASASLEKLVKEGAASRSIDTIFGLEQAAGGDRLARFMEGPAAQNDDLPAIHAAFSPPRVVQQAPHQRSEKPPTPVADDTVAGTAGPAAPAASSAPAAPAAPAALWAAFCQGAGIEPVGGEHSHVQQMQDLGRIMRRALEGTLQLMAVRTNTKYELRAGVTVIQQRNNNPLKFSPDAEAALTQLVQPPLRGFLDGPAAMEDAMQDLVGHSIGTVAGLRSAVEGMLDRFAPTVLESRLSSRSVLDNVLPAARKARLWDLYVQHHQDLREEAQEDFHALFGKAFLAAYEQQVQRLKSSTKPT